MKLFGQIVRTVINTATLPVSIAQDVLTLGGTITKGKLETYTGEKLQKISQESDE